MTQVLYLASLTVSLLCPASLSQRADGVSRRPFRNLSVRFSTKVRVSFAGPAGFLTGDKRLQLTTQLQLKIVKILNPGLAPPTLVPIGDLKSSICADSLL